MSTQVARESSEAAPPPVAPLSREAVAPGPAPSAPVLPLSATFGPEARRLFGWYHAPRGTTPRHLGVVLCNPLGYEALCTHRVYRHLAARLADAGFPVLRFDYDGTGDSAGYDDEPGRVVAWLGSIGEAIDELKRRSGAEHVCLFGMRLGGLFALGTASQREDVRAVALWAAPATGRAYVRELRAFRKIKEQESTGAPPRAEPEPGEEIAGFLLLPSTADDLSALRPLESKPLALHQALLLGRDDLPGAEPQIAKHLTACGVEVSSPAVPGYAGAIRDAEFTDLPSEALDTIVDWLSRADAREGPPVVFRDEVASGPGVPMERRQASADVIGSATSGGADFICAAHGGARVRERAVRFGGRGALFGIVAEPLPETPRRGTTAVLFVSVGANPHLGPNRLHVTMSRELAALGFVAMRLDIAGVGDSPTAPGAVEHQLYSKDSVRDVQEAMSWLRGAYDLRRFVVASVCSGAFLSFHTSVADERVVGQILVNPQTFVWRKGDSLQLKQRERPAYETSFKSSQFYKRAALDPKTWRRLLSGKIQVRRIARELLSRAVKRAQALPLPGPLQGPEQREHLAIRKSFFALEARGLESLLVYSANDGGLDVIERYLGPRARALAGKPHFRMEVVEGADHTFTPLWSQAHLSGLVLDFITRKFG